MTAIDDCRELGLLPEEVELYVKGCATVPWVEHVEKKYADAVLEALAAVVVEQTGEIERLEKTFDELDSWDGHLRWLEKWYPASIFGAPGDVPKNPLDTGCSNVILTRALAAEKARADRLQAELHEYAESYEKMKAERDRQYDENVHRRDRARDRELGYINDQLPPDR